MELLWNCIKKQKEEKEGKCMVLYGSYFVAYFLYKRRGYHSARRHGGNRVAWAIFLAFFPWKQKKSDILSFFFVWKPEVNERERERERKRARERNFINQVLLSARTYDNWKLNLRGGFPWRENSSLGGKKGRLNETGGTCDLVFLCVCENRK